MAEMRLSSKSKNSGDGSGWGTGLLLVFFPDDHSNISSTKKPHSLSSSSSSTSSPNLKSPSGNHIALSHRTGSSRSSYNSNHLLFSRAQSTMSICALIVFVTFLAFTLCTFEPTIIDNPQSHHNIPLSSRRWLSEKSPTISYQNHTETMKLHSWHGSIWRQNTTNPPSETWRSKSPAALKGLGVLFRRGTKAMNDLVIAHVPEHVTEEELRLFLRLLHRSGLCSKSDVAFVSASASTLVHSVIQQESDALLKPVDSNSKAPTAAASDGANSPMGSESNRPVKAQKEPLWGAAAARWRNSDGDWAGEESESTRPSFGSVVGFDAAELDPEDSLAGFMDGHVPLSLRRWACYQMLLGRVRRNFKYVMLVDVENAVVIGDPLGRVRGTGSESVYLWPSRVNSESELSAAVVMGGVRGIRRFANWMVVEIVRAATGSTTRSQRRNRNPIAESVLLSQLARNRFVLSNVDLVTSTESDSPSGRRSVILRGNTNRDFYSTISKEICSFEF